MISWKVLQAWDDLALHLIYIFSRLIVRGIFNFSHFLVFVIIISEVQTKIPFIIHPRKYRISYISEN